MPVVRQSHIFAKVSKLLAFFSSCVQVPNELWVPARVFFYNHLPRRGSRNKICRKTLTKDVENKVAENPEYAMTPYLLDTA